MVAVVAELTPQEPLLCPFLRGAVGGSSKDLTFLPLSPLLQQEQLLSVEEDFGNTV